VLYSGSRKTVHTYVLMNIQCLRLFKLVKNAEEYKIVTLYRLKVKYHISFSNITELHFAE